MCVYIFIFIIILLYIGSCEMELCIVVLFVDKGNWTLLVYIQGVPGGIDKTSGECSLC